MSSFSEPDVGRGDRVCHSSGSMEFSRANPYRNPAAPGLTDWPVRFSVYSNSVEMHGVCRDHQAGCGQGWIHLHVAKGGPVVGHSRGAVVQQHLAANCRTGDYHDWDCRNRQSGAQHRRRQAIPTSRQHDQRTEIARQNRRGGAK